jgi:hypothetical protein
VEHKHIPQHSILARTTGAFSGASSWANFLGYATIRELQPLNDGQTRDQDKQIIDHGNCFYNPLLCHRVI